MNMPLKKLSEYTMSTRVLIWARQHLYALAASLVIGVAVILRLALVLGRVAWNG